MIYFNSLSGLFCCSKKKNSAWESDVLVVVQCKAAQDYREQEKWKEVQLLGTKPSQLMSSVSFTGINENVTQHFNDIYVE